MMLSSQQLQQLLQLATQAALKAGEYIAKFDRTQLHVNQKKAGSSLSAQVVTQVDLDSQAIILDILQPSIKAFDFAVLSEENASEKDVSGHPRFQKPYYWCIDPLDGTLPYIEGSNGFAVSIALVEKSGRPIIGVVHNPSTGDTYQAINHDYNRNVETEKVLKNGMPWQPKADNHYLTLYIDRSFEKDPRCALCIKKLEAFVHQQGYSRLKIVNSFGAVMNAIGVLENAPACYLKLPKSQKGGGSLWDFSATAALTQASVTGWVSDIHGEPLDFNRPDSNYMNHKGVLFVSGVESEALLQLMRECGGYMS
ncbi:inositol-1-monophosphatase [Photobacterium sagamiensis]|uniref:3'(2'),5'-bisphosphate nucleotidase CysQ family protein n=1 Tax=Photobacterium sagamiensis TaxID=2910241 RepID=UPI003D135A1B